MFLCYYSSDLNKRTVLNKHVYVMIFPLNIGNKDTIIIIIIIMCKKNLLEKTIF